MKPQKVQGNPRQSKVPPRGFEKQVFKNIKDAKLKRSLQEHKSRTVQKEMNGKSAEHFMCKASALGPTRVVIPIDYASLGQFLLQVSVLISYEIQSRGGLPEFSADNDASEWNPSKVYAFLFAIYAMKFAKAGVLKTSSSYLPMGSYVVPTFVAKHLQQIMPSTHMGREVSLEVDVTAEQFLNQPCGNGGLYGVAGMMGAPCSYSISGDTEPWFAYDNGTAQITAATLTTTDFSKLSAVISRSFKHHVKVSEIGDRASTNELKICPVATTTEGQAVYSCLDDKSMCDLILPLASFNQNVLLNSPYPLQAAAPVRVDGSLAMSPEAKIAFLFWLSNNHPYKKEDSFVGYLRKFGVKDRNLGNLQLNLRQVNWASLFNIVVSYASSLTTIDKNEFWYLWNYVVAIVQSNIPGCFRAFCPVSGQFNISKQYKDNTLIPSYCAPFKNPRVPPFLSAILLGLREPIRTGNQITFYYNQVPDSETNFPWWVQVATNAAGNFALTGQYGSVPIPLENCGVTWIAGPYRPYPLFTAMSSSISPSYRNQTVIRGLAQLIGAISKSLVQVGTNGQNIYNQWSEKITQFTKRHPRFYLDTVPADEAVEYPGTAPAFTGLLPLPKLLASYEPVGYATSLLAIANNISYFIATDTKRPLLPTFSSVPNAGAEDATVAFSLGTNAGQGSSLAVKIGSSNNPADVTTHAGVDATAGSVNNQAEPIPEGAKEKVHKLVVDMTHTGKEMVKTGVKDAGKAAGKALTDAVKGLAVIA